MKSIAVLLASGLGSGFSPKAPGTAGSLAAILIWTVLAHLTIATPILLYTCIILLFILGVWASNYLEQDWGHDPGKIVIDEWVGILISIIAVPYSPINFLAAFVLFRVFDISKILGIKQLEKLPRGYGVMADDVLAGIYANLCLQLLLYFNIL